MPGHDLTRTLRPRTLFLAALVSVALLVLASPARADGIDAPVLLIFGFIFFAPIVAFNVLVEALFLRKALGLSYRKSLWPTLLANLASLLAGFPVLIFNAFLYGALLPRDFGPFFRAYPWVAALATLVYFVVTLFVEYFVLRLWARRKSLTPRRLALFVLLANVATYAVLAPLHYFASRPVSDVREFTADARWASQPLTTIYYIDSTSKHLCSIASDGSSRKEIVAEQVEDFQFMPESGIFLYRNHAKDLCLARIGDPAGTVCAKVDQMFHMRQAAVSPDGKCVAYIRDPGTLVLFDPQADRTIETNLLTAKNDRDASLAWSNSPSLLFLVQKTAVDGVQIGPDFTAKLVPAHVTDKDFSPAYGRFTGTNWGVTNDQGVRLDEDRNDVTEARSESGSAAHLVVTRNGKRFVLDANSGFPRFIFIPWGYDVCILPNGSELIFGDRRSIYLMDMDRLIVGKITNGVKPLIITPRYRRTLQPRPNN